MRNENQKRTRKFSASTLVAYVFLVVGLIMLGVVLFIKISNDQFLANAKKTTGVITSITNQSGSKKGGSHKVYVSYEVGGMIYEESLHEYSSAMHEGDQITLYYNVENPSNVRSEYLWSLVMYILTIVGIVFIVVAVAMLLYAVRKQQLKKRLISQGRLIYATVADIKEDRHTSVMGKHPVYVECHWKDELTNELVNFRSEKVLGDLAVTPGSMVQVYINPEKRKEYFVNLEVIRPGVEEAI